jgi:hypothetical protein
MKKLLITLIICSALVPTVKSHAQTPRIDTALVRNLPLAAYDYCLFDALLIQRTDSVSLLTHRRIRAKVQSNIPGNFSTVITVDSLPAAAVIAFYQTVMNWPAGQIQARFAGIKSAISAKTNLAYWIGSIDGAAAQSIDQVKTIGKNGLVDN